MENNLNSIDSELIILEVKKYPELWNPAEESYNEIAKKKAAWNSITKHFCENFDEQSEFEKNEMCNKIIKRWRNLRDTYTRSLRRKRSHKPYIYAEQLSFLETAGVRPGTQCSVEGTGIEGDMEQPNAQQQQKPKGESEKTLCNGEKASRKKKRYLETPLTQVMRNRIPQPVSAPESNADKSFFESLLPSIRDFTEDQKLTFRCEVITIIQRMRMHLPNNWNLPYIPCHAAMPNAFQQFLHAYAPHPNFSNNPFPRTRSPQTPPNSYPSQNIPFTSNNFGPQNQTNICSTLDQSSPSFSHRIPVPTPSSSTTSPPTTDSRSYSDDENIDLFKSG